MDIPKKAMAALSVAASKKMPVADLEFLGAPTRALSLLDDAGIVSMDQLLSKSKDQLCEIPSLGSLSIKRLLQSLKSYHKLEEVKEAAQKNLKDVYEGCGIDDNIAIRFSKDLQ